MATRATKGSRCRDALLSTWVWKQKHKSDLKVRCGNKSEFCDSTAFLQASTIWSKSCKSILDPKFLLQWLCVPSCIEGAVIQCPSTAGHASPRTRAAGKHSVFHCVHPTQHPASAGLKGGNPSNLATEIWHPGLKRPC